MFPAPPTNVPSALTAPGPARTIPGFASPALKTLWPKYKPPHQIALPWALTQAERRGVGLCTNLHRQQDCFKIRVHAFLKKEKLRVSFKNTDPAPLSPARAYEPKALAKDWCGAAGAMHQDVPGCGRVCPLVVITRSEGGCRLSTLRVSASRRRNTYYTI